MRPVIPNEFLEEHKRLDIIYAEMLYNDDIEYIGIDDFFDKYASKEYNEACVYDSSRENRWLDKEANHSNRWRLQASRYFRFYKAKRFRYMQKTVQ